MGTCSSQIPFCKNKCKECEFVGREECCPLHTTTCGGDNVPTFNQWITLYEQMAALRNSMYGTLGKESRRHIISSLRQFVEVMGYSYDDKVTLVTRRALQEFCNRLGGRGVTLRSKCEKIGQAFARWIRFETDDKWTIPVVTIPDIKDDSDRFHEPPPQLILAISKWYRSLFNRGHGRYRNKERLYVQMMLRYAMRNGDVNRLKWSNFHTINGRVRLEYMPHKTSHSSRREVKIWMDALDYSDLVEYRSRQPKNGEDDFVFGGGRNIDLQSRLNKEIKSLEGFEGNKGLYLCRKLCTHSALKQFGKEHAEAISGDDYKTISRFYGDISALDCTSPKMSI